MKAPRGSLAVGALLLASLAASQAVQADTFSRVSYDPVHDQLIVTMSYDGTNPDHSFSLNWGACQTPGASDRHEISGQLLDNQWNDAAAEPFTKTTHFSLAALTCRPAQVTLWTAPHFFYTLTIPKFALAASARSGSG